MAEYGDLLKLLKGEQDQEEPMMSVGEPASISGINEQAKSPYQQEAPEITPEQVLDMPKMQQDIADYSSDLNKSAQEAKLKDTYGAIPDELELSPQEKLIKELRSIQENKSKEAKTAQEEANKRALLANAIKALGTIGQAQIQRSAGIPIGLKAAEMTAARDVSSPILKERDSMLKQMMDEYKMLNQPTESMTPYQKLNYELAKDRLTEKKEDRERKKQQFKQSMERRESEDFDKKVSDVSKRIEKSGLLERTRAMQDIENYLDAEYNANLDKPKDIDIGGMGVMGGLRPDFLTDEGDVSFRQNVQSLANQLLKVRSGAAVTDQEYRRFLKEVGSGNFSSEKDLMNGLKKMREDIKNQTANITKTYGKDVSKEYIDRTGVQLYEGGKSSDKVSVVLPDGRKGTIQRSKLDAFKKKYPDADILE